MRKILCSCLLVLGGFDVSVALAQDATEPASEESSSAIITYEPEYFEEFNAVTASDVVARVPGFDPDFGNSQRGFGGTAGNILIDGERPSSKNSLSEVLDRIPLSQIERVELIRGGTSGYDSRGQSEVLNIVRRQDSGGSGTFEAQLKFWENAEPSFRGYFSRGGRVGGWNYSASVRHDTDRKPTDQIERLSTPAGALIEDRDELTRTYYRNLVGAVNADATFGDTTVRWNTRLEGFNFDNREASVVSDDMQRLDRVTFSSTGQEATRFELGADIEHTLNDEWTIKLIGLNRDNTDEGSSTFDTTNADASRSIFQQDWTFDSGETLLRSFANWRPNNRHFFEFGAEGAFNFGETRLSLSLDTGNGPQAIPLPISNTRVEEYRAEVFGSWIWQPNESWTIEPGFILEYSEIEQIGQGANQRSFTYPKPGLNVSWTMNDKNELTFDLDRTISQLNFSSFATSVQLNDDQTVIGNPQLEPEKRWRGELEWTRRFWDGASFSLLGRYEFAEDIIDLLPVTTINGDRFDATGNIGDGTRVRVAADLTLPLDRFGFSNARLDADVTLQETSVTDPVTGVDRAYSGFPDNWWNLQFRKDHPESQVAWGFDLNSSGDSESFRLDEFQLNTQDNPTINLFIETTRFFGVTLRANLDDASRTESQRVRQLFDAPRDVGLIEFVETREANNGLLLRLTVEGTF